MFRTIRRTAIAAAAVSVVLIGTALPASAAIVGTFVVQVVDPDGNPVAGVPVMLGSLDGDALDAVATTDADGFATFPVEDDPAGQDPTEVLLGTNVGTAIDPSNLDAIYFDHYEELVVDTAHDAAAPLVITLVEIEDPTFVIDVECGDDATIASIRELVPASWSGATTFLLDDGSPYLGSFLVNLTKANGDEYSLVIDLVGLHPGDEDLLAMLPDDLGDVELEDGDLIEVFHSITDWAAAEAGVLISCEEPVDTSDGEGEPESTAMNDVPRAATGIDEAPTTAGPLATLGLAAAVAAARVFALRRRQES